MAGLLNNLTNPTIYMTRERRYREIYLATTNMLILLGSITHIQQLTIRGPWVYREDELVAFMLKRSKTLKQLALKGPVLSQGSWKTALQKLRRVQFCSMQYLELSNMNRFKDGPSNVEKLHHEWREFQENAKQTRTESFQITHCIIEIRIPKNFPRTSDAQSMWLGTRETSR